MTVIAWDGTTLAADKLADCVGLRRTITKIRKTTNGALIGASGQASYCAAVMNWFESGAEPEKYPKTQDSDDFAEMVVIERNGRVLKYERGAAPIYFEDGQFAMGSGRDYAMAAMFLGCTAEKAVSVACEFETSCGGGCDALRLDP